MVVKNFTGTCALLFLCAVSADEVLLLQNALLNSNTVASGGWNPAAEAGSAVLSAQWSSLFQHDSIPSEVENKP